MDKHYTLDEIAEITRFAKQTIYNKISAGKLQRGIHYIKPSRKKILFKQQAIEFLLKYPTNNPESIQEKDPEDDAAVKSKSSKPIKKPFHDAGTVRMFPDIERIGKTRR